MSRRTLKFASLLAVAAIVPGVLFALDRSALVVGLSTVSVLLIAGSLYRMFSAPVIAAGVAE